VCAGNGGFADPIVLTPAIIAFVWDLVANNPDIESMLSTRYLEAPDDSTTALLFTIILERIKTNKSDGCKLLGNPPIISAILLSDVDLSGINFENAQLHIRRCEDGVGQP
jgi:hypothetical protein